MEKLQFDFSTHSMQLLKVVLGLVPGATKITITQTRSGCYHAQEYTPVVLLDGEHIIYDGTAAGALKAL